MVPCAQAGSPVAYKLGPFHWTPAVSVTQQPRIEAGMTFSQRAGVAGHLTADASARCDIASYVWKFSDGTTAYGERPAKTFSKPGTVTGQLKVTDTSGLSATRDFSVIVSA